MYTKEDFWRDYPLKNQPFAFPWTEEYHKRVIEQARKEAYDKARNEAREKARNEAREKARNEAREKARNEAFNEERKVIARKMRDLGLDDALINKVTGLTAEEIQAP